MGGALTNIPFVRNLKPVMFSQEFSNIINSTDMNYFKIISEQLLKQDKVSKEDMSALEEVFKDVPADEREEAQKVIDQIAAKFEEGGGEEGAEETEETSSEESEAEETNEEEAEEAEEAEDESNEEESEEETETEETEEKVEATEKTETVSLSEHQKALRKIQLLEKEKVQAQLSEQVKALSFSGNGVEFGLTESRASELSKLLSEVDPGVANKIISVLNSFKTVDFSEHGHGKDVNASDDTEKGIVANKKLSSEEKIQKLAELKIKEAKENGVELSLSDAAAQVANEYSELCN